MAAPSVSRNYVEQLRTEANLVRTPVSKTASALAQYVEQNLQSDPLVNGVSSSLNPYKEKSSYLKGKAFVGCPVLPQRRPIRERINELLRGVWERRTRNKMAGNETEEVDVAKELNLLPVIFETIQALQRTSDPQELTKKVNSFRSKLQHCRTLLDMIPGLEMSCEEQKELLSKCQAQYKEKCELLGNYRNLPVFAEAFVKETKS